MNVARDLPTALTPASVNPAWASLQLCRRVLLLQGPVGPFFDRLTIHLRGRGAHVSRIAFQAGDLWDCKALSADVYAGEPAHWPDFLARYVRTRGVDGVVLFGQTRWYHERAAEVLRARGIPLFVLEEGYFRPGYATLEQDGINGRSSTLRLYSYCAATTLPPPVFRAGWIGRMASFAMFHYIAMRRGAARFPAYMHHRPTGLVFHARYWVLNWARRWVHRFADARALGRIHRAQQPHFLVALQLDEDSQVQEFSPFASAKALLDAVLMSFSRHAPAAAALVVKQHPFSRGGPSMVPVLSALVAKHALAGRVVLVQTGALGRLLPPSCGVVTINSTSALIALAHGKPVCALGESVYSSAPGVQFGGLDDFWGSPPEVPPAETAQFLNALKGLTQIPVDLYASRADPI